MKHSNLDNTSIPELVVRYGARHFRGNSAIGNLTAAAPIASLPSLDSAHSPNFNNAIFCDRWCMAICLAHD